MPTFSIAKALNDSCLCQTLYPDLLRQQLEPVPFLDGLAHRLQRSHPHLFSSTMVFLEEHEQRQIADAVSILDHVMRMPAWERLALPHAPAITQFDFGATGVLMGYDFHLTAQGPKLIEINTNAGGAFLNSALARAHASCCESMHSFFNLKTFAPDLDAQWIAMFRTEWASQRGDAPLRTVLITDDAPQEQFLSAEFDLAVALLQRHGIRAAVGDACDATYRDGALWHPALGDTPIDLVYNRLTDFMLEEPSHNALQEAYRTDSVVLTPHPRAHALHANKRHLATLSEATTLLSLPLTQAQRGCIESRIPHTEIVCTANAERLWVSRREFFFKPFAGFGSRATYRGDKLTKRVWGEILAGNYVAQHIAPASERLVSVQGVPTKLKVDIRAYAYRGKVLLLAARTWSGQTTNFRTEGGGFAPVLVIPAALSQSLGECDEARALWI